jgi:hypothetical protein
MQDHALGAKQLSCSVFRGILYYFWHVHDDWAHDCLVYVLPIFYVLFSCSVVAHNLGSETKRAAGIPLFQAIGQCGSVLGSHLFPKTQGPKYMYVGFTRVY